jgi:hypothetical protein
MEKENDRAAVRSLVGALRSLALFVGLAPMLLSSATFANASNARPTGTGVTHFFGQVKSLTGPAADPTGFALQLDGRTVNLHISATGTVFTARSAEAWVDGFAVGDFASVRARRVNRIWMAQRILFDVRPFGQIKTVSLTGTILKFSKDTTRVQLQPTVGDPRWIIIRPATRFRVDGVATTVAPTLVKGDLVQVTLRRTAQGWITVELNLKTSPVGSP